MKAPSLTVGIEEEYQIIDPETRELTSYIQEMLDDARLILENQVKPEFLQSQLEVGTQICRNMKEARQELLRLRRSVVELAERKGKRIVAASTHPFSRWETQHVTAGERYSQLHTDMAELARRMLIFGMHVHVGFDDRDLMIDVMNQARYFVPHLLALSTSSPFSDGRETGLKSYRSIIFQSLPRTGLPPELDSYSDYLAFVDTLQRTHCIEEPTKIWWDIRPHPKFPTLEFRMCDICTRIDEAICLASLIVAIVHKLMRLRRRNQSFRVYRHHLINENKWRAVRFGLDGKLIDFGQQAEKPMRDLVHELREFVDDVVDELDLRREIDYLDTMLANGTSADRQLAVYRASGGDLNAVVDHLIADTRHGWG